MEAWVVLLLGSALVGGLCGWFLRGACSWLVASLLPPAVFLGWLLLHEYAFATGEGGASMWPVAFVIGGTAAAMAGCCALLLARFARARFRVS